MSDERMIAGPVPYPNRPEQRCPLVERRCWSLSFCTIYGCAKHPANEAERRLQAEEEDRRRGWAP